MAIQQIAAPMPHNNNPTPFDAVGDPDAKLIELGNRLYDAYERAWSRFDADNDDAADVVLQTAFDLTDRIHACTAKTMAGLMVKVMAVSADCSPDFMPSDQASRSFIRLLRNIETVTGQKPIAKWTRSRQWRGDFS